MVFRNHTLEEARLDLVLVVFVFVFGFGCFDCLSNIHRLFWIPLRRDELLAHVESQASIRRLEIDCSEKFGSHLIFFAFVIRFLDVAISVDVAEIALAAGECTPIP